MSAEEPFRLDTAKEVKWAETARKSNSSGAPRHRSSECLSMVLRYCSKPIRRDSTRSGEDEEVDPPKRLVKDGALFGGNEAGTGVVGQRLRSCCIRNKNINYQEED